ncbi:MAG: sigma-54-dependent Fis family transcriptional regulator [Endozoicomonadaceae bacterium]|nr:sigma-54-dependent Fis family transcriptional regulator [Endozoicomonadaceae bacterium]
MANKYRILIIEDDQRQKLLLSSILSFIGFRVCVVSGTEWRAHLKQKVNQYQFVLLGRAERRIDILKDLNRHFAYLPILITGRLGIELRGGIKQQVMCELSEPVSYDQLLEGMHCAQAYRINCCNKESINYENSTLFQKIVGNGRRIRQVRTLMAQVMDKEVPILLQGEPGTNKILIAEELHRHSNRKDGVFVSLNCRALSVELLEIELFGYEKDAFPGAIIEKKGRLELAKNGTLFLEEINEIPLDFQAKLLRFLKEGCFEKLGSKHSISVNVRIITSTSSNLEDKVKNHTFRNDLLYQLNVFPIHIPELRNRIEDLPLLLNDIIVRIERENRGTIRFSSEAIHVLCEYAWPGNLKELTNLVERLAVMYPMGIVSVAELPNKLLTWVESKKTIQDESSIEAINNQPAINENTLEDLAILPIDGLNLKDFLSNLEKKLIQQALHHCNNVVARAAEKLKIRRTTLVEKMRKYHLQRYEEDINTDEHTLILDRNFLQP